MTRCPQHSVLLQAIGNIFSVGEDLLGATVLAWGETFPDLMAMIAVARAGALHDILTGVCANFCSGGALLLTWLADYHPCATSKPFVTKLCAGP